VHNITLILFMTSFILATAVRANDCDLLLGKIGAPVSHQAKSKLTYAVAGVENPETGEIFWKEAVYPYKSVAGAYNPKTKKIFWKLTEKKDVDVVYNPDLRKIEWRETDKYENAIAGVYNPTTKLVDWRAVEYGQQGIAAAYNPSTKTVESSYVYINEKQMSAYYSPDSKTVEFTVPDHGYSSIAAYYDYRAHAPGFITTKFAEPPAAVVIPGLDPNLYSSHKVKIIKPFRARPND
jgi:hypothetical protein